MNNWSRRYEGLATSHTSLWAAACIARFEAAAKTVGIAFHLGTRDEERYPLSPIFDRAAIESPIQALRDPSFGRTLLSPVPQGKGARSKSLTSVELPWQLTSVGNLKLWGMCEA